MDLSNLKPAKGSTHRKRRLGRGQGSGYGGTSTRGHKGAGSRSGYSHKIGFEGGQMPLQRRLPKFGFKSLTHVTFKAINLDDLQKLADEKNISAIDQKVLYEAGLVGKKDQVKVLASGSVTSALNVVAAAFSQKAKAAIEEKGGKAETLKK